MKKLLQFLVLVLGLAVPYAVVVGVGSLSAQQAQPPAATPAGAPNRGSLAGVRSWGYQLQHVDADAIARSPYDLVVIDSTAEGDEQSRFSPADVRKMQTKSDGSRRIVLAYLSIGEAESYRFYWNDDWVEPITIVDTEGVEEKPAVAEKPADKTGKSTPKVAATQIKTRQFNIPQLSAPTWLGRENMTWSGNYLVRYWDKGWQDIIFGSPQAYLERIVASGFDGVFLDRVDAFTGVEERPEAKGDMVRFVRSLAERARKLKPGFLIVPQNGEELLLEPAYLSAIDGITKEDLLYDTAGKPQPQSVVATSSDLLSQASRQRVPVFVVEYSIDKPTVDKLAADIVSRGYIPYFGIRTLDRMILPEDIRPKPPTATPATPVPGGAAPPTPAKGRAPPRQRNKKR